MYCIRETCKRESQSLLVHIKLGIGCLVVSCQLISCGIHSISEHQNAVTTDS